MTNDQLSGKWRRGRHPRTKKMTRRGNKKGRRTKVCIYCIQGIANEADGCQEALAGTPQPCSQIP